jgi:hypothetical protein
MCARAVSISTDADDINSLQIAENTGVLPVFPANRECFALASRFIFLNTNKLRRRKCRLNVLAV